MYLFCICKTQALFTKQSVTQYFACHANFERVLKITIIILDIKNRKIKFENHELKSCVGIFNYRHVTFKLLWIGIPCQENLFRNSVLIISETHRSEFVCIVNGYTTYL